MMSWLRRLSIALLGRHGAKLRFPHLLLLTAALFGVDLVIPDAIPFVDEIFLALMALLFATWRESRVEPNDAAEPRKIDADR